MSSLSWRHRIRTAATTVQACHKQSLKRSGSIPLTFQRSRRHTTDQSSPFSPPQSPSSVSQDEVSHFTKLASSWWDPHGPSRLLHLMNPLRHDFIQFCLQSDPTLDSKEKYTYLDIGCGGGIFATSAARLPNTSSVTAIDPTPSVLAVAKAKQRSDPALSPPKLTYLNCAIEDLSISLQDQQSSSSPSPSSSSSSSTGFDILTLFEVIEHITHPSTFLNTALTHLKPGGWLIGSTISRHPLSYLTTKLIAEAPLVGIVPAGTHDWNQYINPDELRGWFDKQNSLNESTSSATSSSSSNTWGPLHIQGVVYIPMVGWKLINGSENYGNYFFGVQKKLS